MAEIEIETLETDDEDVILHNREEVLYFLEQIPLYSITSTTIPYAVVRLVDFDFEANTSELIPQRFAERFRTVPLLLHHSYLIVAMEHHGNELDDLKTLEFITGRRVEAFVTDEEDIDIALEMIYGSGEIVGLSKKCKKEKETPPHKQNKLDKLRKESDAKPIVQLVERIIIEANRKKASDIHLRPAEDSVEYLLRIDGTMVLCSRLEKSLLAPLISRFKILGNMDISEHRIPQDGGAKFNFDNTQIEVRISIMPTINGESLVIRLLNNDNALHKLDQLDFKDNEYSTILKSIHQSTGLTLIAGPTGSGKSTTLYAILNELRKNTGLNIITVEDPVEFHIDGIEQIQINPKTGYTFARALRNILRHDPDVIMIGEIRDEETAKIAIECSLTGHLVLSTIHSIDTASTVTRLLEMGVKPYLLKSTLSCVVAQRLAKLNCTHCDSDDESAIAQRLSQETEFKKIHWHKGTGCEKCHKTGLKGRKGVYELLSINEDVSASIKDGALEKDIKKASKAQHFQTLAESAKKLAEDGLISAEEFARLQI